MKTMEEIKDKVKEFGGQFDCYLIRFPSTAAHELFKRQRWHEA